MKSTPETTIRRLAVFGGYADAAPEMLWHIGDHPAAPAPAAAVGAVRAVASAPRTARSAPALRVIEFDVAPEPVDLRCAA